MSSTLNRKIPWVNQPQIPVLVNPEYADYISNINIFGISNINKEIICKKNKEKKVNPYINVSDTPQVIVAGGYGIKGNGISQRYARNIVEPVGPMWIACQFIVGPASASKIPYSLGGGVSKYCSIWYTLGSVISAGILGDDASPGTLIQIIGPVAIPGNIYTVIAVFPSNSQEDAYLYVNGVKYRNGTPLTITFTGNFTYENVLTLQRDGGMVWYSDDTVLFNARGVGYLPEIIAKNASFNPYILIAPKERLLPFCPSYFLFSNIRNETVNYSNILVDTPLIITKSNTSLLPNNLIVENKPSVNLNNISNLTTDINVLSLLVTSINNLSAFNTNLSLLIKNTLNSVPIINSSIIVTTPLDNALNNLSLISSNLILDGLNFSILSTNSIASTLVIGLANQTNILSKFNSIFNSSVNTSLFINKESISTKSILLNIPNSLSISKFNLANIVSIQTPNIAFIQINLINNPNLLTNLSVQISQINDILALSNYSLNMSSINLTSILRIKAIYSNNLPIKAVYLDNIPIKASYLNTVFIKANYSQN